MVQLHSILQSRNLDEGEKNDLANIFLNSVSHPFGKQVQQCQI